jgi:hypothetical protein
LTDQRPRQWPWTSTVVNSPGSPDMSSPGLSRTSAAAAGSAGTGPHLTCVMVNTKYVQTSKILCRAQEAGTQGYKRSSSRQQAFKPSLKGTSFKPESTSSRIRAPGYKRTSSGSGSQATRINVFKLCFT